MEVFEAIKKRRSIRSFDSSRRVSDEQVEKLLEAARWAPSAGNLQSWFFVVVRDKKIKERFVSEAWVQELILEAPVVIVVCSEPERTTWRYGERGTRYTIQDTAIATQNIWLAATAMGLGASFLAAFDEKKVAQILNLKKGLYPIVILSIGYPAESPTPPPRRSLKEISKIV
ncbi:MAG: nitroreductase family protein [Patescibacteria group bacterium]